jgi:hypothetical protein
VVSYEFRLQWNPCHPFIDQLGRDNKADKSTSLLITIKSVPLGICIRFVVNGIIATIHNSKLSPAHRTNRYGKYRVVSFWSTETSEWDVLFSMFATDFSGTGSSGPFGGGLC